MELNLQAKINFFSELITCSHNLHYWCYNPELILLSSNCEDEAFYDALFSLSYGKDYLRKYLKNSFSPVIYTDSLGLMWIITFELSQNTLTRIHSIGLAFISDISLPTLEKKLSSKNLSIKSKKIFIEKIKAIPILSVITYFQYGQMLHYTISGEKIPVSTFHFPTISSDTSNKESLPIQIHSSIESHGTWAAEQELMRMVEEGNLNYQAALDRISVTGSIGQFNLGDPSRQLKDYMLSFIVLCCRAAMRGGLSPELAYTLSDFYIQSIENSSTLTEFQEIGHTMFHDYVTRVHDLKQNTHISKQIQDACNYIQVHSGEKLNIADIAEQVGYAEYYFSKKFKKEVGISVKDYINQTKINRAKILLNSPTKSIQDISDELCFCSQSYFTETFRKYTGMTPIEYRSHSQHD